MDYTKLIVSTIGDVLSDAEDHGMKPTPSMKRLAAYGLLVEAQLDAADILNEKLPEDVHFTPDGEMSFEFTPEWAKKPKVKRKNGRKNCKHCSTRLTGLQRVYCSKYCSKRDWAKNNPDRVKAHYDKHYKKSKQKLTLVK
jgi:hypothetical protein